VSTAGQKKGIFGLDRAKTGQVPDDPAIPADFSADPSLDLPSIFLGFSVGFALGFFVKFFPLIPGSFPRRWPGTERRVRGGAIDVMSLPASDRLSRFPIGPFDHAARDA
jgi:hypothetical protein